MRTPRFASALVVSALLAALAVANPPGKKVALLVGVNQYKNRNLEPLEFAENDATRTHALLKEKGFDATLVTGTGGTLAGFNAALDAALAKVGRNDLLLVGLAGHGVKMEWTEKGKTVEDSFFCPQDCTPEAETRATLVSLTALFDKLDRRGAGVNLILIDACRNDPSKARGRSVGIDGDTSPQPPRGTAALYSCSSGERAFEHQGLRHGIFFHHVIEGLSGAAKDGDGEVTWDDLQKYVRRNVTRQVPVLVGGGARQTPSLTSGELRGEPPLLVTYAPAISPPVVAGNPETPEKVKPSDTAKPAVAKPAASGGLAGGFTDTLGKFVPIPRGTAWLGGGGGEPGTEKFTLNDEVYCGIHEVTQAQWQVVMGSNPSHFKNVPDAADCPVESVSYTDIATFLERVNASEKSRGSGHQYRLPTEKQWEYICRGGPMSSPAESADDFYCGPPSTAISGNDANFDGNHPAGGAPKFANKNLQRTCKVGSYWPNKLGIYDMHGNVWEWTSSLYKTGAPGRVASGRGVRGGSWILKGGLCSASERYGLGPDGSGRDVGFRLLAVPSK